VTDAAVQIRRGRPDDAPRLAQVGQATFLETFAGILDGDDILAHAAREHSVEHYERCLGDVATRLWLAEVAPGRAPVGLLVTSKCTLPVADVSADDLEVKRIYLLHRFHGCGVGARLMQTAIDWAQQAGKRRVLLGVYAHNARAIAFYERYGFVRVGQRRFAVGANQYDDLVLARPVTVTSS
jgi:ribosomal protein S18 acetylase RimI-like enzyme